MIKKAGIGLLAVLMLVLPVMGAQAVTEADYAASGGSWVLIEMVMDGTGYRPADIGMTITLNLKEDGSLDGDLAGDPLSGEWSVREGIVYISMDGLESPGHMEEDRLVLENGDQKMIFARPEAAEAAQGPSLPPAGEQAAEDPAAFSGTWQAAWVLADGMTISASAPEMTGNWEMLFGSADQTVVIEGTRALLFGSLQREYTFAHGRLESIPENTAGMDDPDVFSEILSLRTDGLLNVHIMGIDIVCDLLSVGGPGTESTPEPTAEPTAEPTPEPTAEPTVEPTTEPTAEPTPEPTPRVSYDEAFVGEWFASYMRTGRVEGDPMKLYGMEIILKLEANHSGSLSYLGVTDAQRWSVRSEGEGRFGEDRLTLRPDGFLILRSGEDSCMIFHQDRNRRWKIGTPID
ncbi:MAG: PT domain-containing protein [Clostridia bacterium]|nr:PT domain-containing protein [Clostridia bacterium]